MVPNVSPHNVDLFVSSVLYFSMIC
jgi:hypothetical protein